MLFRYGDFVGRGVVDVVVGRCCWMVLDGVADGSMVDGGRRGNKESTILRGIHWQNAENFSGRRRTLEVIKLLMR